MMPSAMAMQGRPIFDESREMELAAELLSVGNEQELEQFLGGLFKTVTNAVKSAGRVISTVAKTPAFKQLGGVLKRVAKVGLPIAGRIAGTALGGPMGGMIGGKLGSLVGGAIPKEQFLGDVGLFGEEEGGDGAGEQFLDGNELGEEEQFLGDIVSGLMGGETEQFLGDIVSGILGGELESMPPSEREFEAARRYVQLAANAARNLALQPQVADARAAALSALQAAAKKSGIVPTRGGAGAAVHDHGRWVRRGNQIVIFGA